MGLPWWKLIVQGEGGEFCFCPRICHVHTSHYHLKTIQGLVRVWIMKHELWSINMTSTRAFGRDSPSQDLTPPDNHIPSRFFFVLCFLGEICKKRRKMKCRREWEALPFWNSEPTLSSTFGHTFTTWFDFSSVSREFSKDCKSDFHKLAAEAFKRGKTHASTSLFTTYFPCLDWSRKWCEVLFNQSGTNPKTTTDIWLSSR